MAHTQWAEADQTLVIRQILTSRRGEYHSENIKKKMTKSVGYAVVATFVGKLKDQHLNPMEGRGRMRKDHTAHQGPG